MLSVITRRTVCRRALSFDHGSVKPEQLFIDQGLSERYAKYRPHLPIEHVQSLVKMLGKRPSTVIDVGCGPGVSTKQFVGYSDKIIGVDVSETQIAVARQNVTDPSVTFIQGTCDSLSVEDGSADIVIAVQAAHYFDLPAFFKEVDRVLRPGGVLALACLLTPTITNTTGSHDLDRGFKSIFYTILGKYMSPVIKDIVQASYSPITLPYRPKVEVRHVIQQEASYEDVLHLLSTYSPFDMLCKERSLSYKEGLQLLDDVMSKNGVSDVMKASKHCMNHPVVMIAAHKPT